MTLLGAIKSTFVNYFDFSGRASRSEYWFFILFVFLIGVIISSLVGDVPGQGASMEEMEQIEMQPSIVIYQLFFLIPLISFSCRRLHDMNYCNWWLIIYFIPIIGPIALYIWFVFPSDPKDNKYGPPITASDQTIKKL